MPNLTFMWLMTDHTGATGVADSTTVPDPVAQVADNDLAVGRVDRHDLPQQVLEEHGDLRRRGRHPERRRSRRRPPRAGVRRQPVLGVRRGRPVLHAAQHGQDDRADPRHPCDEPGGPGGRADVRRVHAASRTTRRTTCSRTRSRSTWARPGGPTTLTSSAAERQRGRTQGVRAAGRRPSQHEVGLRGLDGVEPTAGRPSTTSTVQTASIRSR